MSIVSANMKRRAKKSRAIFVKASQQEHTAFTQLAIERHTTLSELIRQLLYREVESQPKEQVSAT